MNWTLLVVIGLLVAFVVSEMRVGDMTLREAFVNQPRTDTGLSCDGWGEESGYVRDLRFSEAFVDVQGSGVAMDFCRAVRKKGDPDSLHIACALGQREGMSTTEYKSATCGEGMRFSRDDYWKTGSSSPRMSYCRILKDETTGEWFSSCIVPGRYGFKKVEERDVSPPANIRALLTAYQGILTWFRWHDDREDYAGVAAVELYGRPVFPTQLRPTVTRGLQLNRWTAADQQAGKPVPPLRDYLRWGERKTLSLDQTIAPSQIRAIAFWVWWDAFEKEARILDSSNGGQDAFWVGVEGGDVELSGVEPITRAGTLPTPAQEVSPAMVLAVGQLTEPLGQATPPPPPPAGAATYVFEVWDGSQRIMRLAGPQSSAKRGTWQHVALTTTTAVDWWPRWQMYVDGVLVAEKTDGRLSPAALLAENYIGKNVRGCIQDLRLYRVPMTADFIGEAIAWGKPKLHPSP